VIARARSIARDPSSLTGQAFLAMPDGDFLDHLAVVNLPAFQEAEIPGVNGTGTARSIARLFAVLAEGGELACGSRGQSPGLGMGDVGISPGWRGRWPRAGSAPAATGSAR
jgi:hypothetical protein